MIWDEYKPVKIKANKFPFIQCTIDKTIKCFIKDKLHRASVEGPKFLGKEQIGTNIVAVKKTRPVYSTRQVPIYGNGNEWVQITQSAGSYNSQCTVYNHSPYTITVKTNGDIGSATVPPRGQFTDNHCTYGTVYLNGQQILSGSTGTKYLNTVIVGYRTETYQSGTEEYTEYEEQPVYNDKFGLVMGVRRRSK